MDWCSIYLTPQGLPKYFYLSPPLIFPTTYNRIRTKNRPVWFTPGAAPIRWMGPIRNPRWEQKRTEGYVIVSRVTLHVHVPMSQPLSGGDIKMKKFHHKYFKPSIYLQPGEMIFSFYLLMIFHQSLIYC
jgi:hypothetical protein